MFRFLKKKPPRKPKKRKVVAKKIKKKAVIKKKAAGRKPRKPKITPKPRALPKKGDGVKALFEPRGVAIIGASGAKAGTAPALFRSAVENMSRTYKGKTHIIDLSGKMEGAFKDVKKVRGKAELAVLALPPDLALKNIKKVVDAGVRAIVVSPSYEQGQQGELSTARGRARILGPNSAMGVINTHTGMCTSFERGMMPKRGGIAIVSQSNSVGAAVLDSANIRGIGVSKFVSLGDRIDVDAAELVTYLSKDKDTRVICIGIGDIRDGRRFIDSLRAATEKKPVVVLRAGVAQLEDKVYDAAFKQARAIRVQDVEEMLDVADALAKQPPMMGNNVVIISNARGPAVLAIDAIHREGLALAKLTEKTAKVISQRCPGTDVSNPIELGMEAKAKQYELVLKNVLADPNVDGVIVINMLKSRFLDTEDVRAIAEVLKKFKKPVVDVAMGGESYVFVRDVLKDTNVPAYNSPERAASALKALRKYGRVKEKIKPPVVSKAAKKR